MEPVVCTLVASPAHQITDHPESPGRFGQFDRLKRLPRDHIHWIEPARASVDEVCAVHARALIDFLQQASRQGPAIIDSAPTYVTPGSWEAALLAAGGALACTRAVLTGQSRRAFAIVRPPGHHAEPHRAMGFCLLNNLAIAVRAALAEGVRRVWIVDFDAHHGNGTQAAFLDEARVGFISTHQGGIYPGTGGLEDAPHARGRIANLPLPAGAGDGALAQIFEQAIQPLARRFAPEMLFVSAGYDGHWSDPLTDQGVSTRGYFELSARLAALADELCGGKVVFVLEGGYDPAYLAENVSASLAALAGGALAGEPGAPPPKSEPDIGALLARFRRLHDL
jgi:acetoin utilization deacetylase AcuC-like enzyme